MATSGHPDTGRTATSDTFGYPARGCWCPNLVYFGLLVIGAGVMASIFFMRATGDRTLGSMAALSSALATKVSATREDIGIAESSSTTDPSTT